MRWLLESTPRRLAYTEHDIRGSQLKPIFRGLLHAAAAIAIPFTHCFSTLPPSAPYVSRVAFYTFVASCFSCYFVSAMYHIVNFNIRFSSYLQRIDQAFIFVLTAGSYTPSALMAPSPLQGCIFLLVVWTVSFVGAWHVVLHNRLNWFIVSAAAALPFMFTCVLPYVSLSYNALALTAWGAYAVGFVCYVTEKPRLLPTVFGYHEVFHLCVVAAGFCTAQFNQEVVQYYIDKQLQLHTH